MWQYPLREGSTEQPHGKGQEEMKDRGAQSRGSGAGAGQSPVALEVVKQRGLQLAGAEPCGCRCGAVA